MLMLGWTWGLLFAPQDAVQGNSYRIIFLHVPSVIFAELIYFFMAVCALMHLVWRVKLAAYLIKSAAPIGAMITFIGLLSGSIWGIPTWGTWWQWDARITSTLILFIMYLGILTLHGSFNYKMWRKYYSGASGLMGLKIKAKNKASVIKFVNSLKLFGYGYSWGGFESLALHQGKSERGNRKFLNLDKDERLVRLHIGLEDPKDLIDDLRKSLKFVK